MAQKIQYNDIELIALLRQKDQRAYNYLYDNYSGALYAVIRKITGERDESADILQEAFVKIWKNIEQYDADKGRLFTWMLNITKNTAIDFMRSATMQKQERTDELSEKTPIPSGSQLTYTKTDHLGLDKIVSHLKDDHRVIIDLAYFKGYTQEEISKALNLPLGTVKTRARNALLELKRFFK